MRVADYSFRDLDTIYGNPSELPEDLANEVRLHVTSEVDKLDYLLTKQVFRGVKNATD